MVEKGGNITAMKEQQATGRLKQENALLSNYVLKKKALEKWVCSPQASLDLATIYHQHTHTTDGTHTHTHRCTVSRACDRTVADCPYFVTHLLVLCLECSVSLAAVQYTVGHL